MPHLSLEQLNALCRGQFRAMASPCELLLDDLRLSEAAPVLELVAAEAWRIEAKFSRYRDDNLIHAINASNGSALTIDDETADLLDFADQVYQLSDGRFDVTSGVLRRAWTFDGSDRVPSTAQVHALLALVGWDKVVWQRPMLRLRPGMEIDLGGLGKEYAVDRAFAIARGHTDAALLVNFGGDLRAHGPRANSEGWLVGIERPGAEQEALEQLPLIDGALTTSGDARRFLLKDGVRYGHILDPRSGWPMQGGPRSVTVLGPSCLEAGILSTLALLMGAEAEDFLRTQEVRAWCVW